MKVVYIAHPFSDENPHMMSLNRARAKVWMAWALRQGVCPIAPWIPLTEVIPETPVTRRLGLKANEAAIARCDEIYLCGLCVTPGMEEELDFAESVGVTVVDYTGSELPPGDG